MTTKEHNDAGINIAHVSRQIANMNPYAYPLLTMLHNKRKVKSTAVRTEFYDADVDVLEDTSAATYTMTGSGETDAEISVTNVRLYKVGDTVLFPLVVGASRTFMGLVIGVNISTNKIRVKAINGLIKTERSTLPTIPVNTPIIIMGSANGELVSAITPVMTNAPKKDYNYCQNFMAMIDVSQIQEKHLMEADWGIDEQQRARILSMKNKMEFSYLFGARGKTDAVNDNGEIFTCNGITRYMPGATYTTVDAAAFTAWQRGVFEKDGSSDEKFVFAGTNVLDSLMLLDQFKGNTGNIVNKHGVNFFRVESPYGTLYARSHPMMRMNGLKDTAVFFDFNNLEVRSFIDYNVVDLELKTMGMRNSNAKVLQSVECPIVRNAQSHLILTKI